MKCKHCKTSLLIDDNYYILNGVLILICKNCKSQFEESEIEESVELYLGD